MGLHKVMVGLSNIIMLQHLSQPWCIAYRTGAWSLHEIDYRAGDPEFELHGFVAASFRLKVGQKSTVSVYSSIYKISGQIRDNRQDSES